MIDQKNLFCFKINQTLFPFLPLVLYKNVRTIVLLKNIEKKKNMTYKYVPKKQKNFQKKNTQIPLFLGLGSLVNLPYSLYKERQKVDGKPILPYAIFRMQQKLKKKHQQKLAKQKRSKLRYLAAVKRNRKNNVRYVKILRKLTRRKQLRFRARKIYKYILITKQAYLQYFKRFSLKTFSWLANLYRRRTTETKFEKFLLFFELRIVNYIMRLHYSSFVVYSNFLIINGQIRVNGDIIIWCDYHVCLHDMLEIAYRAFFRQYFKKYIFRLTPWFQQRQKNLFFKKRSKSIFFGLNRKLTRLPRWLFFGFVRAFRIAHLYAFLNRKNKKKKKPINTYFIQSNNALATIMFKLPRKFKMRRFAKFMTKKHLQFFSNFCLIFV